MHSVPFRSAAQLPAGALVKHCFRQPKHFLAHSSVHKPTISRSCPRHPTPSSFSLFITLCFVLYNSSTMISLHQHENQKSSWYLNKKKRHKTWQWTLQKQMKNSFYTGKSKTYLPSDPEEMERLLCSCGPRWRNKVSLALDRTESLHPPPASHSHILSKQACCAGHDAYFWWSMPFGSALAVENDRSCR